MSRQYLNLILLVALVTSLKVEPLTKAVLENLKTYPDNTNHFIFFHDPTLQDLMSSLESWSSSQKVRFHINNCKENKLPECQHPEQTPLLLLFNRVLIRFNGDPTNTQQMNEWMQQRAAKEAIFIHNEQQLVKMLDETPNVFCFCSNQKSMNDQNVFHALTKTLPFLNYCVIRNGIYYQTLGLKAGNLTYFKTNTTHREEFVYPNRLDAWEWFIKSNMLPTIPRAQDLVNQRFSHKQKNIEASLLTCDLSYACEKVLAKIKEAEDQLRQQALGFKFYLALQDKRESFTFNLYYHLTFDMSQMPYFIYIHLVGDGDRAGELLRFVQKTSEDFTIQGLKKFRKDIKDGKIQPFFFSDKVPKSKSGFTGKGSERLIQKLVAANIKQQITKSPNHYILLISALGIGCDKCDEFYHEFKQIASLLVEKDVTFGYLNANKNQISLQQVVQLPEVFLFKKDDKLNPIRLDISHSFAHLRNFLRDNLGTAYSDPDEL